VHTLRRHLARIVGVWLICHLSVLGATTLVVSAEAVLGETLCTCLTAAPGAVCPMHGSHQGEHDAPENPADCVLTSGTTPAVSTLSALLVGVGVIPASEPARAAIVSSEPIALPTALLVSRPDRPESPPPRLPQRSVDIS
jgi:hypothetical protein